MMNSSPLNSPAQTRKTEELLLSSIEVDRRISIPQLKTSHSDLRFNRLQPPADQELIQEDRVEFGHFVAREALLDEEYWTVAWLRAESHWEGQENQRYVDNYKRKFAEQEFNALKRLCKKQHNQKCACIVTVKKEERNEKRTILKSVVGTLDLSIRYLLPEETFPGERVKAPIFCSIDRASRSRYGYIANLCVAKSARRQGIAKNMLHFAINLAKSNEAELVFVHVYRNNRPAQELYRKMGFQVVERATGHLSKEQTYLLCFKY
ncbi:GCN5-related N-acetyltransferase 6, chloroplastic [Sarracenia purpurea var. burkii]